MTLEQVEEFALYREAREDLGPRGPLRARDVNCAEHPVLDRIQPRQMHPAVTSFQEQVSHTRWRAVEASHQSHPLNLCSKRPRDYGRQRLLRSGLSR